MAHQDRRRGVSGSGTIVIPPNDPPTSGTPTGPAASGAAVTFFPTILPFSAPAFQNPFQGLVNWDEVCSDEGGSQTGSFALWNGYAPRYAPVPETGTVQPLINLYGRDQIGCYWRYLEPTMNNYQFDWLEARAAAAHAIGGQFGFRILCMDASDLNAYHSNVMPDYIQNSGSYGGTNGTGSSYHPNFNNNNFLTRLEALWAAIGARFGTDPRFGLMDIGMYGNFGEWHHFGHPDVADITFASGKRIIDAHVNNMSAPNVQWVHLGDATLDPTISEYAMSLRPNSRAIGLRGDSFGALTQWFRTFDQNAYWGPADAANRWKIAPIFGEPANFSTSGTWEDNNGAPWTQALGELFQSHVSMVGNGNVYPSSYSDFNLTEQKAWIDCGKHAGFRFELRNVTIPNRIEAGSHATLRSEWINVGVAPPYRNWNVHWQLVSQGGVTVWEGTSTMNFNGVLPSTTTGVINENFNFPSTLPPGTMSLRVIVIDPSGYFAPMALALSGRASNGSYPVGTITTA